MPWQPLTTLATTKIADSLNGRHFSEVSLTKPRVIDLCWRVEASPKLRAQCTIRKNAQIYRLHLFLNHWYSWTSKKTHQIQGGGRCADGSQRNLKQLFMYIFTRISLQPSYLRKTLPEEVFTNIFWWLQRFTYRKQWKLVIRNGRSDFMLWYAWN